MPETAPLYPEMRVSEYLRFRARLKQIERKGARSAVERAMDKAGVSDVSGRLIGSLSRGYRQRVGLADALLGEPPLLILDEPTAGLDPNQIRSVRSLLRRLAGEHTVLLSTHILSEVESTCSRALVIDRGRLVAEGPIAELRKQSGSQRAIVTIHDRESRGFGVLVSTPGVLGVTPQSGTGSVLPPAPDGHGVRDASDFAAVPADSVASYELTFELGGDPHERLELVVAALVEAGALVREARVCQTTLEEVFGQLTGGHVVDA
jgi:ABC-2 type transport system ATP-binding protein